MLIDDDLGLSGRGSEDRHGFQRLLADVAQDRVGLVLALEMSRLARNSRDWHNLFDLCAVRDVLLADEDGVYDPSDINDRLILGMKGIMSEMELHMMRDRLERGRRNKAQRGELFHSVPWGYVLLPDGTVVLDPDEQVRATVRRLFDAFQTLGTAYAVVRDLRRHDVKLPIARRQRPARVAPGHADDREHGAAPSALRRRLLVGTSPDPDARRSTRSDHPTAVSAAARSRNGPFCCTTASRLTSLGTSIWPTSDSCWKTRGVQQRRARLAAARRCWPACCTAGAAAARCTSVIPSISTVATAAHGRVLCRPTKSAAGCPRGDSTNWSLARFCKRSRRQRSTSACVPSSTRASNADGRKTQLRQNLDRATYEARRAERQYQTVEPENRLVARTLEAALGNRARDKNERHRRLTTGFRARNRST